MATFYSSDPTRLGYGTSSDPTSELIIYSGILRCWTGATWITPSMKVYTGTWQSKPMKMWNGSSWVLINITGA